LDLNAVRNGLIHTQSVQVQLLQLNLASGVSLLAFASCCVGLHQQGLLQVARRKSGHSDSSFGRLCGKGLCNPWAIPWDEPWITASCANAPPLAGKGSAPTDARQMATAGTATAHTPLATTTRPLATTPATTPATLLALLASADGANTAANAGNTAPARASGPPDLGGPYCSGHGNLMLAPCLRGQVDLVCWVQITRKCRSNVPLVASLPLSWTKVNTVKSLRITPANTTNKVKSTFDAVNLKQSDNITHKPLTDH
jgi:hypothetical protein